MVFVNLIHSRPPYKIRVSAWSDVGGWKPSVIVTYSEGVRRLALLLGSIGIVTWLIFAAVASKLFTEIQTPEGWVDLVVFAGISFLMPFLFVHAIALVIQAFREDK